MTLDPWIIGDQIDLNFEVFDACGQNLIDLRPWVIVFTLKRSNLDPDNAALFQGTTRTGDIVISDQTVTNIPGTGLGWMTVEVPASVTKLLRAGVRFHWSITLFDSSGAPFTPLHGTVRAVGSSTQTIFIYS